MEKTVCELFAGVGGFRVGLEASSKEWRTVWANQWEPGRAKQHAYDCYVAHFGSRLEYVNEDIANINKNTIPDHNLLVGGFPCQDYSVAQTLAGSNGIEGKKGVLWWQIRDVLLQKKPSFVLLENVDRLLKSPASQRGRDFAIMLACFAECKYNVEWRVINAADYGCAQRRRRIFIFAYKENTKYAKKFIVSDIENWLSKEGFFATAFPVLTNIEIKEGSIQGLDLKIISDTFSFPFMNTGCMKNGVIYTADTEPIYEAPITLGSILQKNVDSKYNIGNKIDKWEYLKGAKKIEREAKNGHKYIYSEGPVGFPDSLDKPARTMLTSESTVNRSSHAIQDPESKEIRIITPIEAERIQGFPDDWTNTGMTERFRYFCMGNALVVPLITRMGKELIEIFDEE